MKSSSQQCLADELISTRAFVGDPYPAYRRLREKMPIGWSELWGQWLVTRYADVVTILRDTRTFSSTNRFAGMLDALPQAYRNELAPLYEHVSLGVANTDSPEHSRLRALTNRVFHPAAVECLRLRIQGIVDELLQARAHATELDVVSDLAFPLPTIVISELLGISIYDRAHFKHLVDATMFHGLEDASTAAFLARARQASAAVVALTEWLRPMIADRRQHPTDDLLSDLVEATERGDILSESELVTMCIVLVRAGHFTTMGLIANGVLALLRNQDQLRLLQEDPSLLSGAIEEMLRFDTPFLRTLRRVVRPIEIGGTTFPAGDTVSLMLGSATRDSAQFVDPDRFDIRRLGNRHVGFGYGIHYCMGAPLARLEAEVAITMLFERWPTLILSPRPLQYAPDNVARSLERLPVCCTPGQRPR
jgi:cytochrome P450